MPIYFFIDFDNTIFSHRTHRIPEDTLQALSMLRQEGHKFILSSGRHFLTGSKELTQLSLRPDCFVSANGALVEAEGKLLKETFVDRDVQRRLLDFVLEKGYCLSVRYQDRWYCSNLKRFSSLRLTGPQETVMSGDAFLSLYDKPVGSFFLADSESAIEDTQAHFPELKLLRMGSELGGADVIPKANSKANGIPLILEHYGASIEESVAIGDSMNDLDMIRTAGLGIAMGNAMPQLQAAADFVAPDIDAGGLTAAIEWALIQKDNKREKWKLI